MVTLTLSLRMLYTCIVCASFLDLLGLFEGLGFNPSFQLEAQPLFLIGVVVAVYLVAVQARLGPLLAGVIFWVPIVFLIFDLLYVRKLLPFGGDIVGISEVAVAIVGVVAAHNVYHKFPNGLFGKKPISGK